MWGCPARAVVSWQKGDDRMEVGLVDRKTLKFQFLNTREQGIVWSQLFSQEIGCWLPVLCPPSPKPNKFCKRFGTIPILISLLDGPVMLLSCSSGIFTPSIMHSTWTAHCGRSCHLYPNHIAKKQSIVCCFSCWMVLVHSRLALCTLFSGLEMSHFLWINGSLPGLLSLERRH